MLEAKASIPTTSIAGGLFMLKRTIKSASDSHLHLSQIIKLKTLFN
ncbi:MAG: hypothetical protein ACLUN8_00725 [Peptoniphilus grossensis]